MPSQDYVTERFNNVQDYYKDQATHGLWKSEAALIDEHFHGTTIVDLGCGTGRTSFPLQRRGYEVTAVDIADELIDTARAVKEEVEESPIFHVGDARDLPFDDDTFDNALFSNQGLMQIPGSADRLTALHEIKRVLCPGGTFIFTTHVRTLNGYFLFWMKQWCKVHVCKPLGVRVKEEEYGDRFFTETSDGVEYEEPQYIHIPTVDEVKELLEQAGLKLIEHRRANDIAGNRETNPMFYVCKKEKKK